jgi:hypothetical protein
MKPTILIVSLLSLVGASRARASDPQALLTQGKLDVDMGDTAAAAIAFEGAIADPDASSSLRGETLVRLGLVRRGSGDEKAAAEAFARAWRDHRQDKQVLALLVQALGEALPGEERWDAIWRQLVVRFDGEPSQGRSIRVEWPGVPLSKLHPHGAAISLDVKQGSLQKLFRLFADVCQLNVVVQPGVHGTVTFQAHGMPWDEALDRILPANGYAARLVGPVLEIGEPAKLPAPRRFDGAPTDIDFNEVELVDALRQVAERGGRELLAGPEVGGKLTLRLVQVPWDQAFDLIARLNGLTWQQAGTTLRVQPR